MFYTIYKTTNKINGKFYYGCHVTADPNDAYLGSGVLIRRAIKKYGEENFHKEVLFIFDNEWDMFTKEKEIVSESCIHDPMCYNLTLGGSGSWFHTNSTGQNIKESHWVVWKSVEWSERFRKQRTEACKNPEEKLRMKQISLKANKALLEKYPEGTFKGRKHSQETILKMRKPKSQGEKNSQFGTMWITNGVANRKIKKYDDLPEGWEKGRK